MSVRTSDAARAAGRRGEDEVTRRDGLVVRILLMRAVGEPDPLHLVGEIGVARIGPLAVGP